MNFKAVFSRMAKPVHAAAGVVALLSLLLLARSASATTMFAMDLPELVRSSDDIVIALFEAETSRYDGDGSSIVTDARLRVLTTLKGATKSGAAIIVTRMGGTVDRIGLNVPGEAMFPHGQSAIVFLRRIAGTTELRVTGMSQGVLPIQGKGSDARVLPSAGGAALVVRDAQGKLVAAPSAVESPRSLTSMLTTIQRLVAAQKP